MTVRVIKKAATLQVTCPVCESVLAYEPRDLREHRELWFGFEVDRYRVLDCPKCGALLRPVRPAEEAP